PKDVGTTWDQLDPAIRDVIVDMRFRGDFKNLADGRAPKGHEDAASDFRNALAANTPAAMCQALLKHEDEWHDVWGVPKERLGSRMENVGYKDGRCQE
ncbi:hypothetical protein, partial [Solimonas aquatica]|uniref:hypothetical protein n=1 Tax=Solimonas aquatica TaxID=489703 RepID=UPI0015A573E7